MNERLKELMIQADYPAPELASRAHRLAELIVRECVGIADEYDGAGSTIVSRIKKHFGVDGMSTEDKKTLIKELLGVKND